MTVKDVWMNARMGGLVHKLKIKDCIYVDRKVLRNLIFLFNLLHCVVSIDNLLLLHVKLMTYKNVML